MHPFRTKVQWYFAVAVNFLSRSAAERKIRNLSTQRSAGAQRSAKKNMNLGPDRAVFVRERSFNDEATKRGVGVHRTPAVDLVGRVAVCDSLGGREGDGRGWKELNGYGCCSKQQAQAGCAAHLFRKSRRESLMATLRI